VELLLTNRRELHIVPPDFTKDDHIQDEVPSGEFCPRAILLSSTFKTSALSIPARQQAVATWQFMSGVDAGMIFAFRARLGGVSKKLSIVVSERNAR